MKSIGQTVHVNLYLKSKALDRKSNGRRFNFHRDHIAFSTYAF